MKSEKEIRDKYEYMKSESATAWGELGKQMEALLSWNKTVPDERALQDAIDAFSNLEFDLTGDCEMSSEIADETRAWETSAAYDAWVIENYVVGASAEDPDHPIGGPKKPARVPVEKQVVVITGGEVKSWLLAPECGGRD